MNIVYLVVCLATLAVATYTDIKQGKIHNVIFYPALALSLTIPFVYGIWDFLIRLGLCLLLFFLYEGFFGGGDAKLIMMLIMLSSPLKASIAVLIGTLGVLVYSFITNRLETKNAIMNGIVAIRTFNPSLVKGKGSKVVFAPFLFAGFIVATIICGL